MSNDDVAPVSARGPAATSASSQQSISEFLAAHRAQPERGRRARLFGRSPLAAGSHWYWAAVGELDMTESLDRLGLGWCVIHDLPPAGSDDHGGAIGHLIIGPPGIFAVTTYNHSRQNVWVGRRSFVVDGHRLQHIRSAEAAVGRVERALSAATGTGVAASAVIAVIDPGSLRVRDLPRDVFVVESRELASWLTGREPQLSQERVTALAAAAAARDTWPGAVQPEVSQAAADEAARERAEFERVRREVARARLTRGLWVSGVAAVLVAALLAVGILQLAGGSVS